MSIAIIDYDAGNIGSIQYAIEQCGLTSHLVKTPDEILSSEKLILPGVGSFNKAMEILRERKLHDAIRQAVLIEKIPILGICLGMHLFATKGCEGGNTEGLDLIPGEVIIMDSSQNIRLPHVGWNEIDFHHSEDIFEGIHTGNDFYFLHSYQFRPVDAAYILGTTQYGTPFTSIVKKNHIVGVQFHPEKSGKLGRKFIMNFIKMNTDA